MRRARFETVVNSVLSASAAAEKRSLLKDQTPVPARPQYKCGSAELPARCQRRRDPLFPPEPPEAFACRERVPGGRPLTILARPLPTWLAGHQCEGNGWLVALPIRGMAMPLQRNELQALLDLDARLNGLIVRAAQRDPGELRSKAAREECRKMSRMARKHLRRRAKFLSQLMDALDRLH